MSIKSKGRALITGASSGIGAALAVKFAAEGFDLILTARREDRLNDLKTKLNNVDVFVLPMDLAEDKGVDDLCVAIEEAGLEVDILINNAAIFSQIPFVDASREAITQILTLNITTVVRLTHHFLPNMIKRRSGKILNVASLASFHPIPSMDLYAATKAFVLSITESLAENLKGTGVSVTALCPGPTNTDALDQRIASSLPTFMITQAEQVAVEGFDALMSRQVMKIPGEANRLAALWAQHQPRWLIRSLGGLVAKQSVKSE